MHSIARRIFFEVQQFGSEMDGLRQLSCQLVFFPAETNQGNSEKSTN